MWMSVLHGDSWEVGEASLSKGTQYKLPILIKLKYRKLHNIPRSIKSHVPSSSSYTLTSSGSILWTSSVYHPFPQLKPGFLFSFTPFYYPFQSLTF